MKIFNFLVKRNFPNNPFFHFPLRTRFQPGGLTGRRVVSTSRRPEPIFPTFHDSNIPIAARSGAKFIFLLILFLLPGSLAVADDRLTGILQGIRARYGPLPGLVVSYEREVITRSMAMLGIQTKKDLASGKIYFKPPHFLRVQQKTPKPEVVIITSETLWWYIPQKKQVYRYPSRKLGQEMQLLSDIFQGLREVESRFKVNLIAYRTEKGHEIQLNPNPPWEQIDRIKLWVDPVNYHIRIFETYNYLGGMTRFTLEEPTSQVFEKNFFDFLVPEDVTVIEEE